MKKLEEVEVLLGARQYLYKLFQTVFGNEPTTEILDYLTADLTVDACSLFLEAEHMSNLADFRLQYAADKQAVLAAAITEYTHEFIGPTKLVAPPWESVYVTKERLLFQESTLEIRKIYTKHNFLPAEYPHVADDHLALELDFMANLAHQLADHYAAGAEVEIMSLLGDIDSFLREHLVHWLPLYLADLKTSKIAALYLTLAELLLDFIKADLNGLGEIKTTLA